MQPDRIIKMGIAHCHEGRKALPRQTVYENLKMGAYIRNDSEEVEKESNASSRCSPGCGKEGTSWRGTCRAGEQQMLVICRALIPGRNPSPGRASMGWRPWSSGEVFEIIRQTTKRGRDPARGAEREDGSFKIADKGYILESGRSSGRRGQALLKSKAVQEFLPRGMKRSPKGKGSVTRCPSV